MALTEDSTAENSSEYQGDYGDYGPLEEGEEQPPYRPRSDQTLIASAVFLVVGGLSIVYGFMQRKKKE